MTIKSISWISSLVLLTIAAWSAPMFAFAKNTSSSAEEQIIVTQTNDISKTESILDERTASNKVAVTNPFSLSQHRRNYILPITYISNPNTQTAVNPDEESIDNIEAKYQVSVKLPLYIEEDNTSGLYVGFTTKSYWQVYNGDLSKPFRATDYEPEIYYLWQDELSVLGFKFNELQFGFNHQSNGGSNEFSRSWNRVFASVLFSDNSSFYYFKAWYRVPENEKSSPDSPRGDDNPDITDYLGNIELGYGTKWRDFTIAGLLRNNLKKSENKGSIELNITYPLGEHYDILLQYFNGYGDSLIDYNRNQERVGLGVQLRFF